MQTDFNEVDGDWLSRQIVVCSRKITETFVEVPLFFERFDVPVMLN